MLGGNLSERFFKFLAFRLGDSGRLWLGGSEVFLENESWSCCPPCCSAFIPFAMILKEGRGAMDDGDSGDEPGEVSVIIGESNVEMVVVGDESVDSEAIEGKLSCERNGRDMGSVSIAVVCVICAVCSKPCCVMVVVVVVVVVVTVVVVVVPVRKEPSLPPPFKKLEPPPNLDMKDGKEAGIAEALGWIDILDRGSDRDLRFV